MTSVSTDRRFGVNAGAAIKVPCRAATTANITLSGEQTIDGVACVTNDRVLVKDQTDQTENGIYFVDTGPWVRAPDADGNYDWKRGTLVHVLDGTSAVGSFWECTTQDPIVVDTSNLTFSRVAVFSISLSSQTAIAGQTVINLGATYATGSQSIGVFVNGLRQRITADYTESSNSSITFTYPLQAGDEVDVYIGTSLGNLTAAAASLVAITDAGDFYIGTTVEAVLQEIRDAITIDNGDASANLAYNSNTPVQRWNTALTATRSANISTNNAKEGAHFVIIRGAGATGNFGLQVVGAATLCTLWAPGSYAEVRYDAGTGAWVLEKQGLLESGEKLGITSDNGDTSQTLTVGTDETEQRWNTTLTADRTASLDTTGAWRGAKFRVVRSEASTGNFDLIVAASVGGATLIRLATGQWADAEYTGSVWVITGYGNLKPMNSNVVELFDDFFGYEIDAYRWQSVIGTDPNALQAAVRADQQGGVIRLTTGSDAGATMALNGTQVSGALNWRANKGGLACEFRVTLDSIANVALFIGLTDQNTTLEMPFTRTAGVLTSNATDAVGVLFDSSDTNTNWKLVGVAADVDATTQDSGTPPVAATFETWRVELSAAGVASFYRNGTLVGAAMAAAVTASVALCPVIAAFARTNTSKNIDADLIGVRQQR